MMISFNRRKSDKKSDVGNLIVMCLSVCMMGVAVSLLRLTHFGTDPCSAMNYGISYLSGISFGAIQVLYNVVTFGIVLALDRSLIGAGTFANMFLVGYMADLCTWILTSVIGIRPDLMLIYRIVILILGIAIFVIFAGIYANSGKGLSTYDGIAFILHHKLQILCGRDINYIKVRIPYDGAYMLIGIILGGEAGVVTLMMVLFLGPTMDFVRKCKSKFSIKRNVDNKSKNEEGL